MMVSLFRITSLIIVLSIISCVTVQNFAQTEYKLNLSDKIAIYDNVSDSVVNKLFKSAGFKTLIVDEIDLKGLAGLRPSMIVIAPQMKFPPVCRKSLAEYLSTGGNLMVLSPKAFDYDITVTDKVAVAKFGHLQTTMLSKPVGPFYGKQITEELVSAPGIPGPALLVKMPKITDVFIEIPLEEFRSSERSVICFSAKGDYEVNVLTLKITDESGKEWVAFKPLKRDWQYMQITMADFLSIDSKIDDVQLDPSKVVNLSIGITTKLIWGDKEGSFGISTVYLAGTSSYAGVPSHELRRWRIALQEFGIEHPEWVISPYLDASIIKNIPRIQIADSNSIAFHGSAFSIPPIELNAQSRAQLGSDKQIVDELKRDSMRRVPILYALDENGKVIGNVGEIRFLTGGYYSGSAMALFGLQDADYSNSLLTKVIIETTRYILTVPKTLQVTANTAKNDTEELVLEILVSNPLKKEVNADISVSVANSLLKGEKQIKLPAGNTKITTLSIGKISDDFPLTKFGWKVE